MGAEDFRDSVRMGFFGRCERFRDSFEEMRMGSVPSSVLLNEPVGQDQRAGSY
jgi:hypothetical protein